MTFVDALRALAALAVVLFHARGGICAGRQTPGDLVDWLSQNVDIFSHGVDVFFVISGFVIAHSVADERVTAAYVGRFALRRSLRLDPPYWAAIILMIAVTVLRGRIGHEAVPLPSLPNVAAHLVYLQRVIGFEDIIIVFWTLCLEVQFYLVFVLLLMVSDRMWSKSGATGRKMRGWVTFGAFSMAMLWPLGVLPAMDAGTWFGPHWHKFLIGAVIWYAWSGRLPRSMLVWPIVMLAVALIARHWIAGPSAVGYPLSLWVGFLTAALFIAAAVRNGFYGWLAWRPLQICGAMSYSIYLVHVPVIDVTLGLQKRLALGSPVAAVGFVALIFIATLAAAWLLNRLVERPSIRLASRFKAKRDNLAGGIEAPAIALMAT